MHEFAVNEMLPIEFDELRKKEDLVLIDVREDSEIAICKIDGAIHIRMNEIPSNLHKIPKDKKVVLQCHHGMRSKRVAEFLLANGFDRKLIFNLTGGIDRYASEIDSTIGFY
jgi:rhodanese-related sulfurtransferase